MTIVRYTVKPGQAEANADLIRAVFAELEAQRPVSYRVYRDGDAFLHVADGEGLTSLPAFRAFLDGHAERCASPPLVTQPERVGEFSAANG